MATLKHSFLSRTTGLLLAAGLPVAAALLAIPPATSAQAAEVSVASQEPGLQEPGQAISLRWLLAQAEVCSPAMAEARTLAERHRIEEALDAAANSPTGALTAGLAYGTSTPSGKLGAAARVEWSVTNELTLYAEAPTSNTGSPATGKESRVGAAWSKQLWPALPPEPSSDAVDALAVETARLRGLERVVSTFFAARSALTSWELARERANLAAARWERETARFHAGEIGLSAWQEQERRLNEAQASERAMRREVEHALWELAEAALGGCETLRERLIRHGGPLPGSTAGLFLDDLDWSTLARGVYEALGVSIDAAADLPISEFDVSLLLDELDESRLHALLQSRDVAFEEARFALREAERSLRSAEQERLPKVATRLQVDAPLAADDEVVWSARLDVAWDLNRSAQLHRKAETLNLESARRALDAAKRRLLWEGRRALEGLLQAREELMAALDSLDRVEQASHVVELRVLSGFASSLEQREAQLARMQAIAERERALAALKEAWLGVGMRLGAVEIGFVTAPSGV